MAADLDLAESDHDQMVSGRSLWGKSGLRPQWRSIEQSFSADIAVIGGGITGALVGEHLTARGFSVVIIDREKPGFGSTAASTAMLQWETDSTLTELEDYYGFERAAGIYRRSGAAVAGLSKLIAANGIACGFRSRNTLYLAGNREGARDLLEERQLRRRAGLPGVYLEHPDLFTQFEIDRDAAIFSPSSAECDPLLLTWALIDMAVRRGTRLVKASVTALHSEGDHVTAETDEGHLIEARHVVLATGYSMPGFDMPKLHRVSSSWALATVQQDPANFWRDRALIWEDNHPYLYMRTTADNRIVAGGEDDGTIDPEMRGRKLPAKTMAIQEKMKRLWPKADTRVEHAWCGTFGETADGLPLIGPVPEMPHVFAAYGYGGNGITFSYLAAQMIGAMLAGMHRDWFEDFALDRDGPGLARFHSGVHRNVTESQRH
ncbi:glycine/D-amino acid oxidase-like deaminating enzyme [Rhizobium leguminosarum]|uniref:Glycine/D-amino acid oxidase-like deaminating enzyme n=1 Tax=Rhizobium leguminosarum TaxID=384 RepID=A0AAE2MH09_RHILE|nr:MULTISPECIES: FAD-dependent oxidoreductase [Rhizobium]MBB4289039.1 glycine/D-amino acid oxidase-like deaminating enzyme [Rhizobium leguminosarum]MBB4294868.1 glycine/D-amino acid oxidase-like deaminating enzyme [Rhizobium leguminosarum]MBB4306261.1 glycine/D-amino acid oxidase-like deaminating enzyme [Rhizobium leguminosarum]MBB4418158.1 glycine/D-amino acid oxidase-like deaminating enzyme [Rhizobium leguminosarum]MBB4433003.1 glycine/D-amino acid oxidase-like deaminating enzyme [Rhizobium 